MPFKTICFYNTFIWVLVGRPHNFLTQLLEVPSYIALLVKGEKSLEKSQKTPPTPVFVRPEDVVEETPKEEHVRVESEPLATPLEASSVLQVPEPPKEEEILPLENMFKFEEDLFSDFGNTSNYYAIRKSLAPSAPNQHLPNPTKEKLIQKTMKELTTIISNDWLGESKLSPEVICLDSPSTSIRCQIHKTSFDAFYNLVVGVNLMSKSFAHTLRENFQLTPTTKLLKVSQGKSFLVKEFFTSSLSK